MKKHLSLLLALFLLFTCVFTGSTQVQAAKKEPSRAIGIVFDNSGSMYTRGNMAWCHATYAMEVFASMLNPGDTLLIYPMHPITIGKNGKTQYTQTNPYKITDASQASTIREIFTPGTYDTPLESLDAAITDMKSVQADQKYLILLTDGKNFDIKADNPEYKEAGLQKGRKGLSVKETINELNTRFKNNAGKNLTMMYLGIGKEISKPTVPQSNYFVIKEAQDSTDTLSALTDMCNMIFGRDTLPKKRITGKTVEFDISMSKLIVFVQGQNVSDVKLTGASGPVGTQISNASPKYSTLGRGTDGGKKSEAVADKSLQGMIVTYTDCAAGSYTLEYSGTATSVEIYYEPNADLDFVFTDSNGNAVDPNALYEGEYKVSFGMKDAKTGQLIDSDLLGNPHYQGSYFINGQEYPITHDGYSGSTPVTLNMNDTFDANLTVTYLSGYTISKDSTDFGWPEGGIQVAARPAGDLRLEISGGQELYSLQDLEEGAPYIAKVYYKDTQLTGDALKSVELKWNPDTSNATIKQEFADDHYILTLHYKNPDKPQDTVCGQCAVTISATYTEEGSAAAHTQAPLNYNIEDDFSPVTLEMTVPLDYIVISELEQSPAIEIKLLMEGKSMTAEEFAAVELKVDCGGIAHKLTPQPDKSSYLLKLQPTEGVKAGDYTINVTAQHTDHIGRTTEVDDAAVVTLSTFPLWVRVAIGLLLLLLLILLIWMIAHIRVLPPKGNLCNTRECTMTFDGEDVTEDTQFFAEIRKGRMVVWSKYADTKVGLKAEVKAGKQSYLYKPKKNRYAEVKSSSVGVYGSETVQDAAFNYSVIYELNGDTGKLERVPEDDHAFDLKNGNTIDFSGTMLNSPFATTIVLNYNKK